MVETVEFGGWPGCKRLSNGVVEVIVTADVGPRVVRYALTGGENTFRLFPDQAGLTGGDEWRPLGGHRFWHAPEAKPRSYQPDNEPVQVAEVENGERFIQPTEAETGIRKTLTVQLGQETHVQITHTLTNEGIWPVRIAPWGLSIMNPLGTAILPQPDPEGVDQLLPDRALVLWPYSRLSDPRLWFMDRFLCIQPDPAVEPPCKVGLPATPEWCGYVREGVLFLKRVRHQPGAEYPDFGSGLEVYVAGDFLELETVAPLVTLQPGESTSHVEHWSLFTGADASSEEAIRRTVLPRVQETESFLRG